MDTAVSFPTSPKAAKAAPLKLSKRMSVEQALEAVVRSCIDQVRANTGAVVRLHDGESLHQLRVGLRRLDAALALFGDVACIPAEIERGIAWLMDQLGPARDWDVLASSTLRRVRAALPAELALNEVQQALAQKQEAARAQAGAAIGSPRFEHWLDCLERWVDERGWREGTAGKDRARLKMRVTGFARAILEQEQQRLLKRGSKLKGADVRTRHRVRVAAKRTRYAAQFFASLYPRKQVRPYVQALSALQDELGWLNDADVAETLLAELDEGGEGLREGAALVRGYLAACTEAGEDKVRGLWKKVAPLAPTR